MSLPTNIRGLLHGKSVEWERLEFKAGWNPEETLHTLCAFANDFHNLGGGYILLGVAESDGLPVLPPKGLAANTIDRIQQELLNLGNSSIQPPYHAVAEVCTVNGAQFLVLLARGGQARPYKARVSLAKSATEMAYYIRKGSSTVKARNADERELLSLAITVPFDDRMNPHAGVSDLSRDLIVAFLAEIESDLSKPARRMKLEVLGRQLGLVAGPSEAPLPVNVGLLFFNEHPERFFPVTQIDVIWFPEGAGGDVFEEKVFKGPLARTTREALEYIRRNYISDTVIKHVDRAEATRVQNFPYTAIEEALVNAVYHRSYEVREPIEVRISPAELVVVSYPGPDRSIRRQDLRRGKAVARRYRNRRIGDFLKELELTEGRSTGIPKILRAMKTNGSPAPSFEFDEDHSYFITRLRVQPAVAKAVVQASESSLAAPAGNPSGSGREQVVGAVTPPVTPPVAPPVVRLLRLLYANGAMGSLQIRRELGLKDRTHLREIYVAPALAAGLIEYTIPDKPTSRFQRYRLTALARAWLAAESAGREPT